MHAFRLPRLHNYLPSIACSCLLLLACVAGSDARAQDLSWVSGAIERTKTAQRESLPAWQYDPRVAASNADASLNAIAVVNADRLFAVGDRGLILASVDGGRTWLSQNSSTSMNLYGVNFVDELHGIAVGGTIQPLSQSSIGIVLITSDGGKNWQAITTSGKASLPRLTGISYDGRSVRVWGDYASVHGSGVFESQDQGHTWQPIPCALGHVQAIAGVRNGLSLGIDHAGRLSQVPYNSGRAILQLAAPNTPVESMIHTGSQWLAVGDAGTITSSSDGANWVDHALPLTPPARAVCSFRCATTVDQNLWVAGAPGSILMHSPNAGASWRVVPVDQSWSISAIRFVDRNRGWFVTSAGSIWTTRDSGVTWFAQRLPVKRLGLQAFASSASHISWPALANAAWQARQATELVTVYRENIEDAVDAVPDAPSTLGALGTQIGLISASYPSQWPVPGARVQLPAMSSASSSESLAVAQQIAMRMRAGRPSIVLIDDMQGISANSEGFTDIVTQAMWMAENDHPSTAWLRKELHLEPWKANKLVGSSATDRGDITISAEELLRDSGLAMQDVLAPVFGQQSIFFPNINLRCLQLSTGNNASRQNLFTNQDRSADAARAVDLSKIGNLQLVMGRAHRDKAWQALGPTALNVDEEFTVWSKKLETVIQQTPKHECGAALLQLADRCLAANQWDRWSLAVERLSTQTPQSDSARYGSLLMLRMAASDEFLAWQNQTAPHSQRDGSPSGLSQPQLAGYSKATRLGSPQESTPFDAVAEVKPAVATSKPGSTAVVQTAAAEMPARDLRDTAEKNNAVSAMELARTTAIRRAVNEFIRLNEADRALVARPDLQLTHFARRRALAELAGEPMPDAGTLQVLTTKSWLAGWPQVAAQEFIMAGGRAERPSWSARATRAADAPVLDGVADDSCWQAAPAIELANPFLPPIVSNHDHKLTTQTRFAYDDEFLYVYVLCPNVTGASPKTNTEKVARHYDMKLEGTDHFVLQLDTDRDYTSACELAINQAGHTYDRCCEYSQWNPFWKVAVKQSGSTWSAECAIRLSDLTTRPPTANTAWAISAFRFVPNWGVQSWSQLRSATPQAQGSGLLVFE